ncbi:hypothetical protein TRFO_02249 [Tritrichomonas foetus]|uniref:Homologous-pairing protein 2 homolog n=2 Tax=Tritrichomonas TaxID=5723 RepID=A0A1J4J7S9_9EUKA|nr:Hop2 [Tritrichomonas foetus]OHS95262.1 hypothetical protein TRFO_02249 [Tritrichomonas foetus]|eukprot:OHS95262.1 hypothetical protein TRFO_02249 [Tritrichomonas foetus]
MPPKSKADPSHDILQLIKDKNRPFSAQTLVDELHGEYGLAVVKKAVDQLATENKCSCKVSGKAKLYFANQEGLPVASPEQLEQMDANLENLREQIISLKEKVESLRTRRNQLANTKPFPELVQYRQDIEQQVQKEEQRRDELIALAEGITPEDAQKFQKDYNDRCAQWKARRGKCMEIIDQLSEGCGKKPAELIAEMELETDEALGLKLEYKDKRYTVYEEQ